MSAPTHLVLDVPQNPDSEEDAPFRCHFCFKCYKSEQGLQAHIQGHSGDKPFACSLCNNWFSSAADLSQHMEVVHGNVKPYSCDVCGKSFKTNAILLTHQKLHSGEKPFKCPECNKSFANSSGVTYHLRTHTGEKPYACDQCDKKYGWHSHLNRHKLKAHGTYEIRKSALPSMQLVRSATAPRPPVIGFKRPVGRPPKALMYQQQRLLDVRNMTREDVTAWLRKEEADDTTMKALSKFDGRSLLRLTELQMKELCGVGDGIRLFNVLQDMIENPPVVTDGINLGGSPQLHQPFATPQHTPGHHHFTPHSAPPHITTPQHTGHPQTPVHQHVTTLPDVGSL
eukprot:Colp12_sorted_trinity150504_noHs@6382